MWFCARAPTGCLRPVGPRDGPPQSCRATGASPEVVGIVTAGKFPAPVRTLRICRGNKGGGSVESFRRKEPYECRPNASEDPVVHVSGKGSHRALRMAKSDHCIGALSDDRYVLLIGKAWVPAPARRSRP